MYNVFLNDAKVATTDGIKFDFIEEVKSDKDLTMIHYAASRARFVFANPETKRYERTISDVKVTIEPLK